MVLETAGTILISIYFIITAWLVETPFWFSVMITVAAALLILWAGLRFFGITGRIREKVRKELLDVWYELTGSINE